MQCLLYRVFRLYITKFNINKKTDFTFCFGKICHYFILNGRLPVLTFYRQRIDESLYWVKGLFPKNSNHGLRTLSLLVSLYFFSSKNAILTSISNDLTTRPQTQRQSCPIAHSQPQKSEDLDGLDLIA